MGAGACGVEGGLLGVLDMLDMLDMLGFFQRKPVVAHGAGRSGMDGRAVFNGTERGGCTIQFCAA